MKLLNLHNSTKAGKASFSFKRIIVLSLIISMAASYVMPVKITKADTNKVDVLVNYLEETAVVTAGTNGSTKFYMSTDNKNWEALDTTTVDISGLLSTKEVILYFKGNKDLIARDVRLLPEDKSLQVSYSIKSGVGSYVIGTTTLPVEYKNGSNGAWKAVPTDRSTAKYEVKGTTLYFRTAAAIDRRAGKIITIKISKKPTAPSVRLDAGKLCITGMKYGQTQYRVGNDVDWKTFMPADQKATSMDLRTMLNTPSSVPAITGSAIELRTLGSDKKLHSAVKIIEIQPQPTVTEQMVLSGTTLTITDTNRNNKYEYYILPKGSVFDLNKARWSPVTSNRGVVIRNASVGDQICVRLKSATDSKTRQVILPSTIKTLPVASITIQ